MAILVTNTPLVPSMLCRGKGGPFAGTNVAKANVSGHAVVIRGI